MSTTHTLLSDEKNCNEIVGLFSLKENAPTKNNTFSQPTLSQNLITYFRRYSRFLLSEFLTLGSLITVRENCVVTAQNPKWRQ